MRRLSTFAFIATALLGSTNARAEFYGNPSPPPLYPYMTQNSQPYAVRRPPKVYHPTEEQRGFPYVGSHGVAMAKPSRFDRRHDKIHRASIDKFRIPHFKYKQAGREPDVTDGISSPLNIARDPPLSRGRHPTANRALPIIERRQVLDSNGNAVKLEQLRRLDSSKRRVIAADAEVTVYGPDHISIQLFRKGQSSIATARRN